MLVYQRVIFVQIPAVLSLHLPSACGVPVATEWAKGVWRAEASPEVSILKWSSMTWMIWGWPYFMKPPNEENSIVFEENENPKEKPRKHEDLKMKIVNLAIKTIKNWGIGPCLKHRDSPSKKILKIWISVFHNEVRFCTRHRLLHETSGNLSWSTRIRCLGWRPNIIEPYKQ